MAYPVILPSGLPLATSVNDSDLVVCIQSGSFVTVEVADLRAAADLANRAAQANFEAASDAVNTVNKFGGRLIYDTTSGSYVYTTGSETTDPWLYLHTAATAYTPS